MLMSRLRLSRAGSELQGGALLRDGECIARPVTDPACDLQTLPVTVIRLTPSAALHLPSRSSSRFLSEPPKGKGSRMLEASGLATSARLPLLYIVHACRREQGANVLVAADSSIASDQGRRAS